jgi:hypothetical protein
MKFGEVFVNDGAIHSPLEEPAGENDFGRLA